MKTLAEQHPEYHAAVERSGLSGYARALATFFRGPDMERAIGLSSSLVSNGIRNESLPATRTEMKCAEYWRQKDGVDSMAQAAQPLDNDDAILMVVVPSAKVEKVQRVLRLMGCEVEDV